MAQRIVLEEQDSGIDVFLKEIAKYASPEYQLALKDQERADTRLRNQEERDDARMELDRRKFYEDREQQRKNNERNKDLDELNEKDYNLRVDKFEEEKFNTTYKFGKESIDELLLSTYGDSLSASEMDVNSVLAIVPEGKARQRLKSYVQKWKDKGVRSEAKAQSFMDRFNEKRPKMQIDLEDARVFSQDEVAMRTYLHDMYIKEKPEITPDEQTLLDVWLRRLSATETKRNKLMDGDIYSMPPNEDSSQQQIDAYNKVVKQIESLDGQVSGYEGEIAKITSKVGSDELLDAFNGTGLTTEKEPSPVFIGGIQTFAPTPFTDDNYDIAFGTDAETEQVIVDNAITTALNNATGNNVAAVASGYTDPTELTQISPLGTTEQEEAMEYTLNSIQEAINNGEIENVEQAKELGVPESIIAGLNFAEAKTKDGKPEVVQKELFPEDVDNRTLDDLGVEMAGDLKVEPIELDDFSNLPKAPAPTIEGLKSLNIKDDKGEELDVSNPAKFQSQLKSMYNKVFRKGSLSRLSKDEYIRLNKELIRMFATGSGIQANNTNRMTKIIPKEIEMFLKNKKHNRDSIIRTLKDNIKWIGGTVR